ncbi:DUF1501 domain-containing protein [uncultured Xylophilus sp.]|uniref:DUF1501 domain-containing protein n=1 Tax=uncultured Xylophilus sp. TaxID=296832 RepID=UPI0025E3AEB8|nr:DUF1501 domain-containing protein [uncultured Xylophilus sp.]
MHRRNLLKRLSASGLGLVAPAAVMSRAYALPAAADTRFLLVFLRGGYDAAHVLIPTASEFYYASRPTIAIARPAPSGAPPAPRAAIALDADWSLHPSLQPGLGPLWAARQLAFVPFAGTEDLSRSHFETQDSIEAGLPLPGDTAGRPAADLRGTGFLNRLAGVLDARAMPVAFTDGLPNVMAGPRAVPNVSLKGSGRAPFDARQSAALAALYRDTPLAGPVAEGLALRDTVAQEAQAQQVRDGARGASAMEGGATVDSAARMREMEAASRRALSARGFEMEARRMAALMRDRFNLGFIDVGGWDTHVNQGGAQGTLANLLQTLGSGIAAFGDELGPPAWRRTVVVVISEFGRTFRENGTRGTDHGHGTAYWVAGGAVRGGRIAGEQVAVAPGSLNQNRDFPVLNDYRSVLGGLFRRLYGLDAAQLQQVFPGGVPRDIGLV